MLLYVWVFAISLGLVLLFVERDTRAAAAWSATWGLVAGVWIVAPRLLTVQHIVARGAAAWLMFDVFLVVVFGTVGALLGLVCSVPLSALRVQQRRSSSNPIWVNTFWPAVALPFLYLAASKSIEWVAFGRMDPVPPLGLVPVYLGVYLVIIVLVARAYQRRERVLQPGAVHDLWRFLVATAGIGLIVLPYRGPGIEYAATKAPTLRPDAGKVAPLLVIGLDGGNWRTIQPLVDADRLPNFARLIRSGVIGDMQATRPPYWSAPAWASMITGYDLDETGVHEDLAAFAPLIPGFELSMTVDPLLNPVYAFEYAALRGGVMQTMPATRQMLRRIPIWERLTAAGVRTAVIRFPFTYPAARQADFVVSNRTVTDLWDMVGVTTGEHDALIWPLAMSDRLLRTLQEPESVDEPIVRTLVAQTDWPQPFDSQVNPVGVVRRAVHVQRLMQQATLEAIHQQPAPQVVMLYIAGLDNLSHALWQYRHPEDFATMPPAPSAADVAMLGPVLDRYMEWLDTQVGELMAAFGTPPNVLVVSDHGEGPTSSFALWRGWHTADGIFLAAGPGVPHRPDDPLVVQFTDLAPTMLALLKVHAAPDLAGHMVVGPAQPPERPSSAGGASKIAANTIRDQESGITDQGR
jgi:predicted AlkP superfamily phosphohydrolase/phosphomutase